MDIKTLVGETLAYIDVDPDNNEILLTTESGRKIMIYHEQDCCEHVCLEGNNGEWTELIGKVLIETSQDEERMDGETKTALTFKVSDATVISRWVGTSNGYYSEHVDIKELSNPLNCWREHALLFASAPDYVRLPPEIGVSATTAKVLEVLSLVFNGEICTHYKIDIIIDGKYLYVAKLDNFYWHLRDNSNG